MPHSLNRFMQLFEMLCEELGLKQGRKIFKKIINALGEGNRIRVPLVLHQNPLQSKYYWDSQRGTNPTLFRNLRNMLSRALGEAPGISLFGRVVFTLGAGDKVTVPIYKCTECHNCEGPKPCLWRMRRNQLIKDKFMGDNHEELALKWNLDVRTIRRIVNE